MATITAPEYDALERDEILYLPLGAIDPDPEQPRLEVDQDLTDSIVRHGVLQPIEVRPHPADADRFMIVDGERRYRGCTAAGAATIPAVVRLDAEDAADRLVRQLVRNTGRPLTAVEEALAFQRILDERRATNPKYSKTELAAELGLSRSTVGDRLAIAEAPAPFQPLFARGVLSAAAAPIVRRYSEVPVKLLDELATNLREDWRVTDAVAAGKPVALRELEAALTYAFDQVAVPLTADVAKRYQGETLTVAGKVYGTDAAQARRISDELWRERNKAQRTATSAQDEKWKQERAEAERKAKEALAKKRALRRGQFAAIAARMPDRLEGDWLLFAVRGVLLEMQNDDVIVATKFYGVEPRVKKHQYGTFREYREPLIERVAELDTAGRTRTLLELLLMRDANPSSYSGERTERFAAAAAVAGVDLKAVKPGAEPSSPAAVTHRPIGEAFSRLVTGIMKPRELAKTLPQMSNQWVLGCLTQVRRQLAKFDDVDGWRGLNPGQTRERAFLAGAERNEVVADLALLEKAAHMRGLLPDPADVEVSLAGESDDDDLWDTEVDLDEGVERDADDAEADDLRESGSPLSRISEETRDMFEEAGA